MEAQLALGLLVRIFNVNTAMHGARSWLRSSSGERTAEIRCALPAMLEGLGPAEWHPNSSQTQTQLGEGEGERRGLSVRKVIQAAVRTISQGTKDKKPDKGGYTGRHGKLELLQLEPHVPRGRKHGSFRV